MIKLFNIILYAFSIFITGLTLSHLQYDDADNLIASRWWLIYLVFILTVLFIGNVSNLIIIIGLIISIPITCLLLLGNETKLWIYDLILSTSISKTE